ncbi:hypothetical protein ACHFCA_27295 [Delftia tsuruhatensis]
MKIKPIAEACMWLPGFGPEEDPLQVLGPLGASVATASVADGVLPSLALKGPEINNRPIWPALLEADLDGLSGPVAKFEANVAAIELLRKLEEESSAPTSRERVVLNRFTGWGGLPQAFNLTQNDTAWAARAAQLKELLSTEEYTAALESTPNSHYTPIEVVDAVWEAVKAIGFAGGVSWSPPAALATSWVQCLRTWLAPAS